MTQQWNVKKTGAIQITRSEVMAHHEMANGGSKG